MTDLAWLLTTGAAVCIIKQGLLYDVYFSVFEVLILLGDDSVFAVCDGFASAAVCCHC